MALFLPYKPRNTHLEELENARRIALQELEAIGDRREVVAELERDRDYLVGAPAAQLPRSTSIRSEVLVAW